MGNQQKDGVFYGGYNDFLKEGKRIGDYPWSELKFPKGLLGADDFFRLLNPYYLESFSRH